jgi:hypothetical protein
VAQEIKLELFIPQYQPKIGDLRVASLQLLLTNDLKFKGSSPGDVGK